MKRILFPTDFSETAHNAFAYAVKLFGTIDVEYTLIHSYAEPSYGAEVLISVKDILEDQARKGMIKELALLSEKLAIDVGRLNYRIEYGKLAQVIENLVRNVDFDMIVMGTTGAHGMKKLTMGSHTADVIKKVNLQILSVPHEVEFQNLKSVALATDYKPIGDRHKLDMISELVKRHTSELHVVNIHKRSVQLETLKHYGQREINSILNGLPHDFHDQEAEDIISGITDFVTSQNIDLLAVVARKHSFMESMFRKSVTRDMALLASLPLLILRD